MENTFKQIFFGKYEHMLSRLVIVAVALLMTMVGTSSVEAGRPEVCGNIISGGVHIPGGLWRSDPPPPPPPDQCPNIAGYQYPVPAGMNKRWGWCLSCSNPGWIQVVPGFCSPPLESSCEGPTESVVGDPVTFRAETRYVVPQPRHDWTGDVVGNNIINNTNGAVDVTSTGTKSITLNSRSNLHGSSYEQHDSVSCRVEIKPKVLTAACRPSYVDASGNRVTGFAPQGEPTYFSVTGLDDTYRGNSAKTDSTTGRDVKRSYTFKGDAWDQSGWVDGTDYEFSRTFDEAGIQIVRVEVDSTRQYTVPNTVLCGLGAIQPIAPICAFQPEDRQYCVMIFDENGNANPDYGTPLLAELFGANNLMSIAQQQIQLAFDTGAAKPVFGVIGSVLGGDPAQIHSSACGGAICDLIEDGCITSISDDGRLVGNCCPITKEGSRAEIEVIPDLIGEGGRCFVAWGSHAVTSCIVRGEGITSTSLAGAQYTTPLLESATYTLECVARDGEILRDSDRCIVNPDIRED